MSAKVPNESVKVFGKVEPCRFQGTNSGGEYDGAVVVPEVVSAGSRMVHVAEPLVLTNEDHDPISPKILELVGKKVTLKGRVFSNHGGDFLHRNSVSVAPQSGVKGEAYLVLDISK